MTRITVDDLRSAGICPRARLWCARHGIDWRDFVRNGIDVERLRETGDMQDAVDRVERAALDREARRG